MRRIWTLVAIGVGVLLICVLWVQGNLSGPLPSDATLRARFQAHRSEFDALAAMALADSHFVGASHDWILLRFDVFVRDTPQFDRMLTDAEVRATGRSEYRRLLDRAKVPAISRARDGDAVWFTVKARMDARKGIVYSERPLAPLRPSLDGVERRGAEFGGSNYMILAPHWFLFLDPG